MWAEQMESLMGRGRKMQSQLGGDSGSRRGPMGVQEWQSAHWSELESDSGLWVLDSVTDLLCDPGQTTQPLWASCVKWGSS